MRSKLVSSLIAVVALATVPPPVAHAAAPSLWRGPAGAHVRTPLTPPPRPLLPAA